MALSGSLALVAIALGMASPGLATDSIQATEFVEFVEFVEDTIKTTDANLFRVLFVTKPLKF